MQADIAQIFFPSDCVQQEGYLIGFNIQGLIFTIISVDNQRTLQQLEHHLQTAPQQHVIQQIMGARLQVIGRLQKTQQDGQQLDTWVVLQNTDQIRLASLIICGYEYRVKCSIIFYDRMSSQITFDISTLQNRLLQRLQIDQEFRERISQVKYQKVLTHDDFNPSEIHRDDLIDKSVLENQKDLHELEYSLIHINMRKSLLLVLEDQKQPSLNLYYSELQTKDAIIQKLIGFIISICLLQRVVFLAVLKVFEYRVPLYKRSLSEIPIFKNSLTQVKYKLQIMGSWQILAQILTGKSQPLSRSLIFRAYHQMFAGLTFIAVDTLLGIISLLFLYFNVQRLLNFIHKYGSTIHIEVLSQEVEWLMGFPAGLKTNKPLNSIMGQTILQVILYWNHVTTFVTPYEPYLLKVMLIFCLFGVTFQVALTSDFINLCTIHVYYVYRCLMFLYRELRVLALKLYRVTKDRCFDEQSQKLVEKNYSIDRKVLAMFIGFFLTMMLPTISLYYFWFLFIVLFIYIVNVFLNVILQILNHFPMFLVIQYFRNPQFFPSLVALDIKKSSNPDTIYTRIEPQRMAIGPIFTSFVKKIIQLRKFVDIPAVLKSAVLGQDIMSAIKRQVTKQQRRRSLHFDDFAILSKFSDLSELRKL